MIPLPRLIDQSGNEIGRIAPILASVNLNIVPLSSATLQLKKGDTIQTRALVEMFTINGSAGVFRARAPQYGYGDILTTIELEHSISMLGDFIVNDDIEEQTTASSAISTLFGYYRGGMWTLGQNNVSSTVVMQTNHDSVLDSLMAIMEQIPDYMLAFDQSVFPWRLNIVLRPGTVMAEGRLSRNVSSVQIIYDDSELCTRAYMAWLDGTEAVTYQDADTISQYGIVEKEIGGFGEVDQATAQRIVNLYLAKHKNPKMSVEISAVDLSEVTGETFDKFTLGSMLRLAMPDENVTVEEIITGLRFDDIYNMPYDAAITLAEKPDTVVNIIHKQEKAGGGFGAGGRLKKEEQEFKRFETFYTKTDEKFSWLATDSEWDELAQAGHVTAFTELTRTAHFVEDTAQKELPFDEWKPIWIVAHPEDASLSDEALLVKYQDWITANPYAIYNNEYSDATRTERIISKTGINSLGQNETLTSKISQEAGRIDLVVEKKNGVNVIKTASIVADINKEGSTIRLNADRVAIDAQTTIGDVLAISDGSAWFKRATMFGTQGGNLVTINNGTVNASTLQVNSNGYLKFAGSQQSEAVISLQRSNVANFVTGFGSATESGGQISIPYYSVGVPSGGQSAAGNINFNIAATQYYIDGVAAAEAAGIASVTLSQAAPSNGVVRVSASNGEYEDVDWRTADLINKITLGSGDTGTDVQKTANVHYSNGDSTASVPVTIDANAVYTAGQNSVEVRILGNNDNVISGTLVVSPGQPVRMYPATKIGTAYNKDTSYYVDVTSGTPSSWINMTSSEIENEDLGPNGLDRVRISNSQSDNGSGPITVNSTNYIWLLGSDGNWGVARNVNISADISTSAGSLSPSNPYQSATLYGVTSGNYLPINITCGNRTIHIVVKGT